MDRKKIVIANWKMNLGPIQSRALAEEICSLLAPLNLNQAEPVLCPDFLSLATVAKVVFGKKIGLGSQDCFWERSGAYTGEISPGQLKELGCSYAIIGHSERRQYLSETDEQVNLKVKAALANGLIPVICVGETFSERQEGNKDFIISRQLERALNGVKLLKADSLLVAYEPVWVIGSGQAVSPEEAEHAHRVLRQVLLDEFSLTSVNEQISIIYGGSVKPQNANGFLEQPTVDGILVGNASLAAESFVELVKQANSCLC